MSRHEQGVIPPHEHFVLLGTHTAGFEAATRTENAEDFYMTRAYLGFGRLFHRAIGQDKKPVFVEVVGIVQQGKASEAAIDPRVEEETGTVPAAVRGNGSDPDAAWGT